MYQCVSCTVNLCNCKLLTQCNLTTCHNFFLIAVIVVSRSNLSTIGHLTAQSSNRNNRTMFETCSKLTIKTPGQYHLTSLLCLYFSVYIHVSQLVYFLYWVPWTCHYLLGRCLPFVRRCSVIKSVLKNFTKFTGKHLCQCLFFNKVTVLRPATLFKKKLWHGCFPVNFVKLWRAPF